MFPTRRPRPLSFGRTVAALAVCALAATVSFPLMNANAGSLPPTTRFYIDPDSQVMQWVRANPGDPRQPVINSRIASQPQGIWLSRYSPTTVTSDVSRVTAAAAAAGSVPVLVAYMIPNRDCGGASAGGAPDIPSYDTWVQRFAAGLGSGRVIVILEPDSLALQTCLSAQQISERDAALSRAGQAIHAANPNAKVYLDTGHSNWNSPSDMAARLRAAGVTTSSDGIFTNVSNFRSTSDEVAYTKAILSALGNPGNLHVVVDTSRNGNGPAPGDPWCDPPGRAIGTNPTANTGDPAVDAFLWVKPPGEADGCAAAAGTFVPDLAFQLAGGGSTTTTSPSTTSSSTTSSSTTSSSTTTTRPSTSTSTSTTRPSGGGCQVGYAIQSHWENGFVANVTVRNAGTSVVNGWTLAWSFPGNQQITNPWSAVVTQSGQSVSARNMDYNATIPAGGSVVFGFQASYSGSNANPTAFQLNGTACGLA